jgi:hypothetical protein
MTHADHEPGPSTRPFAEPFPPVRPCERALRSNAQLELARLIASLLRDALAPHHRPGNHEVDLFVTLVSVRLAEEGADVLARCYSGALDVLGAPIVYADLLRAVGAHPPAPTTPPTKEQQNE